MSMICRLKGHDPHPDEICNAGRCFTRCRRCNADLVKQEGAWHPVPKGHRIVWAAAAAARDGGGGQEGAASVESAEAVSAAVPVAEAKAPADAPNLQQSAPAAAGGGPLILVCDDDALVADLLTHRLVGRGYRVSVAADGREGLERVAEARPDAILLDAMMPVMDGYEVLRRLRADPATASIPIIMLTARKQEGDIVSALELGANDFVVKPFIPEELMSRLARLIAA
ncbi:MAG TPA: response regulator [Allosphingosinicella sp.]|jgi:CheY-like chemotaxis protein|nr:response regulator [Allosphingosinicella sp.]